MMEHQRLQLTNARISTRHWWAVVASLCCGLDVMLQEIEDRFSSSGLAVAVRREKVVLKAAADNVVPTDLTTLELPQSFNGEKLLVQFNQLKDFLNAGNFTAVSVSELAQMLGQKEKLYRFSSLK